MKLLHTSDWHIGHLLYDHDRTDDYTDVMRQIADIVEAEQPDAMIVSGDIFHTSNPPASAQATLSASLELIRSRCPAMKIILTAGNHDGASRLEAFSPLLRAAGIHVVGLPPRPDAPDSRMDDCLIDVATGYVLALPYMFRGYGSGFTDALQRLADTLSDSRPLVVTGHTTVVGSSFVGHSDSTETTVGGIESIPAELTGASVADYVALGHIHKPQTLRGIRGRVRYSGSPLAVSFDEQYEHTVTIVEIDSRGDTPQLREVALRQLRPLITVGGSEGLTWKETVRELRRMRKDPPPAGAFYRLNVKVGAGERPDADADAQGATLVAELGGNFCLINGIREAAPLSSGVSSLSMQEFRALSPADIARAYADRTGIVMTPRMARLFDEAVAATQDPDTAQ